MPAKITSWNESRPRERPPPLEERISNHRWFTDRMNEIYLENRDFLPLYVQRIAEEKMRNHALEGMRRSHEVMGLMMGGRFEWQGKEYAMTRDVVTTELEASEYHVRFDHDALEGLFESLDDLDFDYSIVGWYHSHPGIGCFMSDTDISTQEGAFNMPHHSALVLDPVRREMEAYCLIDGKVEARPMGIYWDLHQDPYRG